jgi:hypothetical protein
MGDISLDLPVSGEAFATAGPKVVTALSTIQTLVNGELDDDNLESPPWDKRTIATYNFSTYPPISAAIFGVSIAEGRTVLVSSGTSPLHALPLISANHAVTDKTTKLQLVLSTQTNAAVTGRILTAGLAPISAVGGAGSAITYTHGANAVIAGHTLSASSAQTTTGTAIDFPVSATSHYIVTVAFNGTMNDLAVVSGQIDVLAYHV